MPSDVEVRNAVLAVLKYWRERWETQPLQFERIPAGSATPQLMLRKHVDEESGEAIWVLGLLVISDNEASQSQLLQSLNQTFREMFDKSEQ